MNITTKFSQPHEVDALTVAFPATVTGILIPRREELPEEFRQRWPTNEFCKLAENLFFNGGRLPKCKKGIDAAKARRHLQAVLGSFEPQHEHKIGAAGSPFNKE